MYTIRYDDKVEKIMEEKEVVKKISILHERYKSLVPQEMIIEKEGEYCWEIGIGDKKDRSYILYDVFSDREKDILIAFNPNISVEDELKLSIFEGKRTMINHIICFNKVLQEIEYYFNNQCLSNKLRWHAY